MYHLVDILLIANSKKDLSQNSRQKIILSNVLIHPKYVMSENFNLFHFTQISKCKNIFHVCAHLNSKSLNIEKHQTRVKRKCAAFILIVKRYINVSC